MITKKELYWTINLLVIALGFLVVHQFFRIPGILPVSTLVIIACAFLVDLGVWTLVKKRRQTDLLIVIYIYLGVAWIMLMIFIVSQARLIPSRGVFLIEDVVRFPVSFVLYYIFASVIHCAVLMLVPPLRRFREQHILPERGEQ